MKAHLVLSRVNTFTTLLSKASFFSIPSHFLLQSLADPDIAVQSDDEVDTVWERVEVGFRSND